MGASLVKLCGDLGMLDDASVALAAMRRADHAARRVRARCHALGDRADAALAGYTMSWLENQVLVAIKAAAARARWPASGCCWRCLRAFRRSVATRVRRSPTTTSASFAPGLALAVARGTRRNTRGCSARDHRASQSPLRVGIGGPVGSGKTALTLALCRALRDRYELAVVTNDIYTEEDAQFLVRNEALAADRIIGVETGGCPHTAIREDASINLEAVDRLARRFGNSTSSSSRAAATISPRRSAPELSDLTLYVIDVAAGDKIPRKGGPGITRSDLLVINKIDLAPIGRRVARSDGPRCAPDARRAAVRVHQPQDRHRASTPSSRSSSEAWPAEHRASRRG